MKQFEHANNRENAMFALKEAITSAHQECDIACLQHCLVRLAKYIQHSLKLSFDWL